MKQMIMIRLRALFLLALICFLVFFSCNEKEEPSPPGNFNLNSIRVNQQPDLTLVYDAPINSTVKLSFTAPIERATVQGNVLLKENDQVVIPLNFSYENNDSILVLNSQTPLRYLTRYYLRVLNGLRSTGQVTLGSDHIREIHTSLDSSDKFPQIPDNALLDSIQRRTFRYFWDFGHPVSGLARERNSSGDLVTSGGSGFGIMAILVGINRNYITRTQGLARMQTIVNFLRNNAQRFHGAFPHWLSGTTGVTIPFSPNDNGADLVETSYLINGLLCARQFFSGTDPAETDLRNKINQIWDAVEWNFFRKDNENVLYWHWSPNLGFIINQQIRGWNEAMIVYVLAASARHDSIPPSVYHQGWARGGAIRNGNSYFGYTLPLGPPNGGPLFFAHYSFLGIDPNGLNDTYANYQTQVTNHTKINYEYCRQNPRGFYGYSDQNWGLTACDVPNGYAVNEPYNDRGVIAPTAALSSFPYTPTESMKAAKFFYYKLGDKLWGQYGFYDAFSLKDIWFANSTLAIDQGPIIVMIENYRSGLLWNLFTSCPEIKNGMRRLGFTAPYL